MKRFMSAILMATVLSACVTHYTVETKIDGKSYICKIKIDRNESGGKELQIQHCVEGQLP